MQYERHPHTGELITQTDAQGNVLRDKDGTVLHFGLNEGKIAAAMEHKTIKEWAYICHDADVYSEKDELDDKDKHEGDVKPRHWHLVCRSDKPLEVDTLARWLGIPSQYIDVPKGHGAFLDCVAYLTHEDEEQQAQGKTLYPDDAVRANFDWRKAIEDRKRKQKKYGKDLTKKEEYRLRVAEEGVSLLQIMDEDMNAYIADEDRLRKCRAIYLMHRAPRPAIRLNYYVCGHGGEGKSFFSKAVARALFPHLTRDEEIFFVVGAHNVAFEGYDGQPVIIWDDFRAYELLRACGGRGNFFKIFDTTGASGGGGRQNVKGSSTMLINTINIVNSVQPMWEFLNALVGEYEDADGKKHTSEQAEKSQAYRRFPMLIPLAADDFDIMINKGFVNNDAREYQDYMQYANVRGNLRKIAAMCKGREDLLREYERRIMLPVVNAHHYIEESRTTSEMSEEEIRAALADVGKPVAVVELEEKVKKLQQQFAGMTKGDPDAFVRNSGVMNIADEGLRMAILSLLYGKNMRADGTEMTEADVAAAQAEIADFATQWQNIPVADRPEKMKAAQAGIEEVIEAAQRQTVGGVICPASCKTDKERTDYALQILRAGNGDPAIIAELEKKHFDQEGREIPLPYVKAAQARAAAAARRSDADADDADVLSFGDGVE